MQAHHPALVLCLAAPEDTGWLIQWERHLLPLQLAGHLHLWSERLILAGEDRLQQMTRQVDQADLIVFLLSSDFFVSDECITLMEQALARHHNKQVMLVPLLLRPSTWQDSPLGSFSCLPSQEQAITTEDDADEAFQNCVEGIRQLLGPPMKEVFPKPSFSLHLKQRLQVIRGLQQEYRQRLNHSLQGQVAIELGLHERTDVIASSARLVFHETETKHPLPAGTTIVQVYDRAQFGLLILGKPGVGKTTLLLDLALELLSRAENDQEHPLPIVLSLSSWGTRKLPFARWLQEQMYLVYGIAKKVGAAWIEQDLILFLLDGLDEMDISARSACVVAMNGHRAEHFVPLVVSSRSQEYEQQHARLILPVAIEIQPLEPAEVMTYLAQAGPTLATARAAIQTNATLQQLMTTPLMLMILLLSYRNQNTNKLAQVGSLEDQQRLIFQHYVQCMLERHHHRRTISQPQLLRSLRWLAQNMQKRHLTEFYLEQLQPTWLPTKQVQTIYHWFYGLFMGLLVGLSMGFMGLLIGFSLDPSSGLLAGLLLGFPPALIVTLVTGLGFGLFRGLSVGLICGLLVWLIIEQLLPLLPNSLPELLSGLPFGSLYGPLVGVFFGLLAGLLAERGKNNLAEKVTWSWSGCRKGGLFGLIGGLLLGLIYALVLLRVNGQGQVGIAFNLPRVLIYELTFGLSFGLILELAFGFIFGLFGGLSGTSMNPDLRRRPNDGIRISGWNAIRFGLVFLLTFGLFTGLIARLLEGELLRGLFTGLLAGLLGGLFGGLFGGGVIYFQHYILRLFLWQRGMLPWQTIPLLEEATNCILLQHVGGGYRFIHPLLQEHLVLDEAVLLPQKQTIYTSAFKLPLLPFTLGSSSVPLAARKKATLRRVLPIVAIIILLTANVTSTVVTANFATLFPASTPLALNTPVSTPLILNTPVTKTPEMVINTFCQDLQFVNYQSAYDEYSTHLQSQVAFVKFVNYWSGNNAQFYHIDRCDHQTIPTPSANSVTTIWGTHEFYSGSIQNYTVTFVIQGNDGWKIDSVVNQA